MKKRIILIALLGMLLTGCNNGDNKPTTNPSNEGITLTKTELIGLPEHTYDIEFINNSLYQPLIEVSDYELINVSIKSLSKISVSLLKEGEGYVKVGTSADLMKTISVESIDLKITNEENHIDVGDTLTISLSKDVNATYDIDNKDIAKVENGVITALKQGEFTLTVSYGDIVIEKAFDTYVRSNTIINLDRNSIYVKYHGRNVHLGRHVIMNNVGSGFEVTFYGTELFATLSGWYGSWYGETRITVLVDGKTDTEEKVVIINKATTASEYKLIDKLDEGIHTVKVLKITEAGGNSLNFYGARTDGYFVPTDKSPKLKMEVYGDSITAGYGNLRGDAADGTNATIQDGMQTYATYTATELDADINVQAKSGIGLYTSANVEDSEQVNTGYKYVNYDKQYRWNLQNYIPDIVIINLGTNDHWNASVFNADTYKYEYIGFINNLVKAYGNETAFILASGLMEQKVDDYVQTVYSYLINDTSFENPIYTIKFNQCASGHPVKEEHKAASKQLVKLIEDNGLDVIHQEPVEEEKPVSDIVGGMASFELKVTLQEDYPSYVTVGLEGLGDDIEVYKDEYRSNFPNNPSTYLTIEEGDYTVRFYALVNGKKYYEVGQELRIVHVRKDIAEINLTVGTLEIIENPNEDAATYGWNMSTKLFEGSFTAKSETEVSMTNQNWMAGFVTRKATYGDNYRISTNIRAENYNLAADYIGLTPYYIDDLNFIWCYIGFNADGTLRTIGFTGAMNGKDIGFMDCWTFAGLKPDLSAGFDIAVIRNGINLTVECMGRSETQTLYCLNKDTVRIGVQSSTPGRVYYKNFIQTESAPTGNTSVWSQSACLFSQSYEVISDDSVTINNYNNWMAGFILKANPHGDEYTISANIFDKVDNYNGATDTQIALVPFFQDANNFIAVYLQWQTGNSLKSIGMTGKIGGVDLGWNDFWSFAGVRTTLTKGNVMEITRTNTSIKVTFGGVTETRVLNKLDGLSCYAVGVWCHNAEATFKEFKIIG